MKQLTLVEAKKILDDALPTIEAGQVSRINSGMTKLFIWDMLMRIVMDSERRGFTSATWGITSRNIQNEFVRPRSSYSKLKQENATLKRRITELEDRRMA